jgi:hypothetical protein
MPKQGQAHGLQFGHQSIAQAAQQSAHIALAKPHRIHRDAVVHAVANKVLGIKKLAIPMHRVDELNERVQVIEEVSLARG